VYFWGPTWVSNSALQRPASSAACAAPAGIRLESVTAQLNRQTEVSKDNIPRLSHLRESGAIEQDADVVMFVHREEYYHRGEDAQQFAGHAQIICAKQRNGPVGDVELIWRRDFTRFENKAPERYSEFDTYNQEGGF
jgi:replicative DNA helicase